MLQWGDDCQSIIIDDQSADSTHYDTKHITKSPASASTSARPNVSDDDTAYVADSPDTPSPPRLQLSGLDTSDETKAAMGWLPRIKLVRTLLPDSTGSTKTDTAHVTPILSEGPDAKYACELCDKKFTRCDAILLHMSTVHAVGDEKAFQCAVCSKKFTSKSAVKLHLCTAHGIGDGKSYQCDSFRNRK